MRGTTEWDSKYMRLEDMLDKTRRKFNVPAVAASLISRDESPVHSIRGTRISGQDNPATTGDFFHIGSCSKSVLAVIAGRLVDAGRMDWNTRFFDIFPELFGGANKVFEDITLTDLFRGEAGILKFDTEDEVFPSIPPGCEDPRFEFVKFLIKQLPASARRRNGTFKPLHSNASFTMIAAMLETFTGERWEDMVTRTLRDELGMDMHIGWPNSLAIDQPWGHIIRNNGIETHGPDHPYRLHDLIAPAGNLSMTPESFARYVGFHLEGLCGAGTYLHSSTFRQIHFGHHGLSLGFGNGSISGHRFSATNGSAGTFFCQAIIMPDEDFAFSIMMNAGTGSARMRAVEWLTVQILKEHFGLWWKFWM